MKFQNFLFFLGYYLLIIFSLSAQEVPQVKSDDLDMDLLDTQKITAKVIGIESDEKKSKDIHYWVTLEDQKTKKVSRHPVFKWQVSLVIGKANQAYQNKQAVPVVLWRRDARKSFTNSEGQHSTKITWQDAYYRLVDIGGFKGLEETPQANGLFSQAPKLSYIPSVVSEEWLAENWKKIRDETDGEDTRCTRRAHIWAYDFYHYYNPHIYTQKLVLMYTPRFKTMFMEKNPPTKIFGANLGARNKHDWLFHIVPYLLVKGKDGVVKEMVIDPEFYNSPMTIQEWAAPFLENLTTCPIINHVGQFDRITQSGDLSNPWLCMIRKGLPMYLHIQKELNDLDEKGLQYSYFTTQTIKWSMADFKKETWEKRGEKKEDYLRDT
ncbi:MAG: protein-glutamine glutaminase family protein, partial [Pseudomonadota bacterium]